MTRSGLALALALTFPVAANASDGLSPECEALPPTGTIGTCGNLLATYPPFTGVPARSNGADHEDYCVGVKTYGGEYHCVEYVRRFYGCALGFPTKKVPTGSPWDGDAYTYCTNPSLKGLVAYPNAGTVRPEPNDILVYDRVLVGKKFPHGHVAIVTAVTDSSVSLIEQNWSPTGVVDVDMTHDVINGTWTVAPRGRSDPKAPVKCWLRTPATGFFDDFNRRDSNSVGNLWSEVELNPTDARILNGRLNFPSDDAAMAYRPYEGGAGGNNITMSWVYRKSSDAAHLNEDDGVCANYDLGRGLGGCLAVLIEPVIGHRISIFDGGIVASFDYPIALDTDYNFQWDIYSDYSMNVWVWKSSDPKPVYPQLVKAAFAPATRLPYWAIGDRSGATFDDFRVETPARPGPGPIAVNWRGSAIGTSCSDPPGVSGEEWKNPTFEDGSWSTLTLPDSPDAPGTSDRFYRGHFTLNAPTSDLHINLTCDDGCELFANGTRLGGYGNGTCHALGCVNVPGCGIGYNACVPPIPIPQADLVAGDNVIAVHVSNGGGGFRLNATISRGDPGTCGNCTLDLGEACDPTAPGIDACGGLGCAMPGTENACQCVGATVIASQADDSGVAYSYANDGPGAQCHSVSQMFVATQDALITRVTLDYRTSWWGQKDYPSFTVFDATNQPLGTGTSTDQSNGYYGALGSWTLPSIAVSTGTMYRWQFDVCDHGIYQGFNYPSSIGGAGAGTPYFVVLGTPR